MDFTSGSDWESGVPVTVRRLQKEKIYVGKCTNFFTNIQVAEFKLETKKSENR